VFFFLLDIFHKTLLYLFYFWKLVQSIKKGATVPICILFFFFFFWNMITLFFFVNELKTPEKKRQERYEKRRCVSWNKKKGREMQLCVPEPLSEQKMECGRCATADASKPVPSAPDTHAAILQPGLPPRDPSRGATMSLLEKAARANIHRIASVLDKHKRKLSKTRPPTLARLAQLDGKIRELADFWCYDLPQGANHPHLPHI
jgi:hypothetical protein